MQIVTVGRTRACFHFHAAVSGAGEEERPLSYRARGKKVKLRQGELKRTPLP